MFCISDVFLITAEKILMLMCFFAMGYALAKFRLMPDDAPQTLSKLLTLLFCPALTLNSMATNLNRASLRANADLFITGAVVMLVSIVLARPLARTVSRGDEDLRGIMNYNLLFGNYGYIGYPMIQGIFGDAALSRFLLFAVPLNIVCYTYGRMVVEGHKRPSVKFLLTPLSISLGLGLLIGVLEIPLPKVVTDVLSASGDCMGPISMLISGMILSHVSLKGCFTNGWNYLFAALRLVLLPLVAMAVMVPLGVRGEALFFTGCFMCFPFGNNPIVFREALGLDSQKAAGMTLLSYIFSLITVPVMFTLFRNLAGLA